VSAARRNRWPSGFQGSTPPATASSRPRPQDTIVLAARPRSQLPLRHDLISSRQFLQYPGPYSVIGPTRLHQGQTNSPQRTQASRQPSQHQRTQDVQATAFGPALPR
jgi:hypothetical protein